MWYLHVQIMRSWDTDGRRFLGGRGAKVIQDEWYLRIPELEACIPRDLSFPFQSQSGPAVPCRQASAVVHTVHT